MLLYRARVVDSFESQLFWDYDIGDEIVHGYNEVNSWEAPIGIPGCGRNNITGVSYLYLSNRPGTAYVEIKTGICDLISLATFSLERDYRIIDFYENVTFEKSEVEKEELALGYLFTEIMKSYFVPVSNNNTMELYRGIQILTDYIRKSGVDGIGYRSFYDKKRKKLYIV